MTARLGWYAHHHGRGHVRRAGEVAPHLVTPATLLTSAPIGPGDWPGPAVALPLDVDDRAIVLPTSRALHWAPGHVPGLRARTRDLASWFVDARPSLLVVDVSVEVALLARLAGVPVAWIRQHGVRRDHAHLGAYEAASLLVAPWPSWFDDDVDPPVCRARSVHVGGFSRLEGHGLGRTDARRRLGWDPDGRHVVVLFGAGGTTVDRTDLVAAGAATPGWRWTVVGGPGRGGDGTVAADLGGDDPGTTTWTGWVDDPLPYLVGADVVVAAGGHNAIMDVAAAGAGLVCVPQPRPWDEQVHKATLLDRHRLAHVWPRWPDPAVLPGLLDRAAADPQTPAPLLDGHGAARMACVLDDLARNLAVAG